ncbi:Zn-ribbon domain-containing OB-fold protein [Halioxenophilus sp. WMMB6]|uniref:Zn-ribbon domain-containing OB-fold protein n=1 Tax=Halioxenophilus sp. WMMB6 TaxID=3073815 RepID=UPI00295EDC54|nr:OB-fold domain-containing protein [Halioxenophilus sp. WMMB6]
MSGENLTSNLGPDQRFRQFLQAGEFCLQQCDQCQRYLYHPRLLCPHCGSAQLQWRPVSGEGVVYSTSVVRSPKGDYNIALIDLAEGPRLLSRVVGMAPEAVTIGLPVQALIGRLAEAEPLVLFQAAGASGHD